MFNDSASHTFASEKNDGDVPMVALSFDDGPAYTYNGFNSTQEILNVLESYGARATFFMCASRLNEYNSSCVKRELALGCEIGNHTYDHTHYGSDVTSEDIQKASDTIFKYSGEYPSIFRCPGGIMSRVIQKECEKENMPIAYWSVDTEDWKSQDDEKIFDKAMADVHDGAIILMHDIYPSTAKAVRRLVPALMKKGYRIVTVSELIYYKNNNTRALAGQQYINATVIDNDT